MTAITTALPDLMPRIEPIVRLHAGQYARSVPAVVADYGELYQVGMVAAWELASGGGYDPRRGSVITWATRRVVGAMQDLIRANRLVKRKQADECKATGTDAPETYTWGTIPERHRNADAKGDEVFDPPVEGDGMPRDPDEVAVNEVIDLLWRGIDPRSRDVLVRYYVRGERMWEIADALELSEARVCHIIADAFDVMRDNGELLGGYRAVAAMVL